MKSEKKVFETLSVSRIEVLPECSIMSASNEPVESIELKVEVDEYISIENAVSFD